MPLLLKLPLLIIGTLAVEFAGSIFTLPSISTWYAALNKPFFNPPNWVFGPVWTTLYIMMAVSAYLVLIKKGSLTIYIIQLGLNLLWSIAFFYWHNIALALIVIILLWITIGQMIKSFHGVSKWAAILLYPYLIWVTYASLLNFTILTLN